VLDEERSDAEFGGEALRDLVVRRHAALEARHAVGGDQVGVREVEERSQSVSFRLFERRAERLDEQWRKFIERCWHLLGHCVCDAQCPLFQFELVQIPHGTGLKTPHVETGDYLRKRLTDQHHQFAVHQLLQRHAMLDRGWCDESLGGWHSGLVIIAPNSSP
jgi:hypothetical protein